MKPIVLSILLLSPLYLAGQCFPDRHSTNSASAWTSCSTSTNPNTSRGNGHWIQFDLNYSYALEQMHFWNYNHPDSLSRGVQDMVIDISEDGVTWQQAALLTLPMATGLSTYEGYVGPHLNGERGRYVLITLLNNYGGTCYGLGEVRFGITDEIDCMLSHNLSGDLITQKYEAQDYIYSDGQIGSGNIIEFFAGNEIQLQNDFSIEQGSEFLIDVVACANE